MTKRNALIILAIVIVSGALFLKHKPETSQSEGSVQRYQFPAGESNQAPSPALTLPMQGISPDIAKNIRALVIKTNKKPSPIVSENFIESQKKHREDATLFLWARRSIEENGNDRSDKFVSALCDYEERVDKEFFNFSIRISEKNTSEIARLKKVFAALFLNIAKNYEMLCKYSMADVYYKRALELSRETKEQKKESAILTDLGVLYARKGMYQDSLDFLKESLAIDTKMDNHEGMICNNINLSNVYASMGQDTLATVYLVAARSDLEDVTIENNDRYKTIITNNQALSNYRNGDLNAALSDIGSLTRNISKKKSHPDTVVLFNKSEILSKLGQYDEANRICRDLIHFIKYENKVKYRCSIFYQRIAETTDKHQLDALPDDFFMYDCELYWRIQRGLASGLLYNNTMSLSIVDHNRAVLTAIEHIRSSLDTMKERSEFMRDKKWVYDEMISAYASLHQKYPDKGFDRLSWDVFERKQGREFLDRIGLSGARNFSRKPQKLIEYENKYKHLVEDRIGGIGDENYHPGILVAGFLNTASFERLRHKTHMINNFPEYASLINPQAVSYDELRSGLLKPDEGVLVFQTTPSGILSWVITKEDVSLHTVAMAEEDLTERVKRFRRYSSQQAIDALQSGVDADGFSDIINKSFAEFAPVSSDLYQVLFQESVLQKLSDKKILFIVPTGCLYDLAFEALILGVSANGVPHYLIEDYAVSYLSSASMLKLIYDTKRKREFENRPRQNELLAFANPVFDSDGSRDASTRTMQKNEYLTLMGGDFADLPETEDEVRTISACLKNAISNGVHDVYVRENANRDRILGMNDADSLSLYKYIVFATHAVIPGETNGVLQPAIVLSDSDQGSFLTMNDILGLKINADMVVLSACNTGRGEMIKGEGTFGLARAFMYSGASTAAVNLWAVESMSAKQISTGMFESISNFQSPVRALQSSKLDYLSQAVAEKQFQHLHPFFWAPMILYGNLNQDHLLNATVSMDTYKKPAKEISTQLNRIIWDGKQFLVVGNWDTMLTSPDGINWFRETPGMGSNHILHDLLYADGTYILTEASNMGGGDSIYVSNNLFQWSFLMKTDGYTVPAWGNGLYLMQGRFGNGRVSKDLNSWSEISISTRKGDKNIGDIEYGGPSGHELFVCVGAEIHTSSDGLNWNTAFSPQEKERFYQVIWNGDQFLVVGENHFLISPDGVVWTPSKNDIGNLPVAWTGESYVMVLWKQSAKSHDGIHWDMFDLKEKNTQGNVNSIAWSGNTCVAVGNHGLMIYSHDGITWNRVRLDR
ncbi:CHAT domain-containing protein [Desulfatiferula olefinivorans]